MQVVKRDGRRTEFDSKCIENAIRKAVIADGWDELSAKNVAKRITERVTHDIEEEAKTPVDIEHIQDIVEAVLMERHQSVAKAYILYREKRTKMRRIISGSATALVKEYLEGADWRIRENANGGFSLAGLNAYIASDISAEFWLNEIYTEEIRKAHISGAMHIHDLSTISAYCVGWDLQDFLRVGFTGVRGKISCRPPKHFRSALGQLVNVMFSLQGEAAGAQAVSSFDTLLAPFIRHDKMTYEQVKQSLQEAIYSLNTPTRASGQAPFTNVTVDLICPSILKDVPVVIGGEEQETTYGQYQEEMDIFNRAFADVMMEGDASGQPFSFPIATVNLYKEIDWESPRFNPVWEMTAKYGLPNFANYINSDLSPDDARSMCCRLKLNVSELRKRGGGLFGANPLTGSIGVVTINLPRLAYDSSNEDEFFVRLAKTMDIAKDSLVLKRKAVEEFTEKGLYPYSAFYLRAVKERFGQYWANHFLTIGLVGGREMCLNLIGEDIISEKGKAFAEKVLDFMRERSIKYQEETGYMFNLEATPAESTSFRLALLDRRSGRDMIYANGKATSADEVVYYTNSTQAPVGWTDNLFEVLDHQDSLQTKYTGGTTVHCFLAEKVSDIVAVRTLIKTIAENYHIPFFTITPTFSTCATHGYVAGEVKQCPICGEETLIWTRVVGYLRPVSAWNIGKQKEYEDRKEFKI